MVHGIQALDRRCPGVGAGGGQVLVSLDHLNGPVGRGDLQDWGVRGAGEGCLALGDTPAVGLGDVDVLLAPEVLDQVLLAGNERRHVHAGRGG